MCTAADAASHGKELCAGKGSHTAMASPTRPAPTEIATVSSSLSAELFSRAFHPACSSAAPRTASVTGSESSCIYAVIAARLAKDLIDERPHPLHRRAPFGVRLGGAMELHRA